MLDGSIVASRGKKGAEYDEIRACFLAEVAALLIRLADLDFLKCRGSLSREGFVVLLLLFVLVMVDAVLVHRMIVDCMMSAV